MGDGGGVEGKGGSNLSHPLPHAARLTYGSSALAKIIARLPGGLFRWSTAATDRSSLDAGAGAIPRAPVPHSDPHAATAEAVSVVSGFSPQGTAAAAPVAPGVFPLRLPTRPPYAFSGRTGSASGCIPRCNGLLVICGSGLGRWQQESAREEVCLSLFPSEADRLELLWVTPLAFSRAPVSGLHRLVLPGWDRC